MNFYFKTNFNYELVGIDSTGPEETNISLRKKPKIATNMLEMKKIMKMRKMMSDRQNFLGFPDTEYESKYPEQPDTLLFLQAYSDECQKLKAKHLNYDGTAYVMHCDDDIKARLQNEFEIIYDIRRNLKFSENTTSTSSSSGAKHSRSGSKKETNSPPVDASNENEKLFQENNQIKFKSSDVMTSVENVDIDVKKDENIVVKKKRNSDSIAHNNNIKKSRQEKLQVDETAFDVANPGSTTSVTGLCRINF